MTLILQSEEAWLCRAHIGLLHNIRVSGKDIHINEPDKMTAAWIEKSNLAEFYEGMETWTKIAYDYYIRTV
jgi:predicted NUDIX family phosphoesterase